MTHPHRCYCILCAAVGLALAMLLLFGSVPQASAQPPAKAKVSFINDVAPILKENCLACHDAKKPKRQVRHDDLRRDSQRGT